MRGRGACFIRLRIFDAYIFDEYSTTTLIWYSEQQFYYLCECLRNLLSAGNSVSAHSQLSASHRHLLLLARRFIELNRRRWKNLLMPKTSSCLLNLPKELPG